MSEPEPVAGADAFTHLHADVRAALSERGFSTPTEPQRRAIPPLARGDDCLVVAPTGTGKTETAMLPVFSAIAERRERDGGTHGVQVLYITPLRALNRDMRERLEWWGDTLDVDVDVRHGDTTDYRRQQQAENPPDVLVTTPETLQAMFTGKKLRRALEDVEHVVVDEVHELAAAKRGAQLTIGLEHLREYAGNVQRVGLSATVGDPTEVGRFLTGGDEPTIVEVDVGSRLEIEVREPTVTERDERLAGRLMTEANVASHVRVIDDLVAAHEATLVFVNTRQTAEALGSRLKELGTNIGIHHGSLSKAARIEVEDEFKAGELDGLLCTSSMELGIDVGHIDHVVQYQSPRQVCRLLQRVGRAGHRRDQVSAGTVITTRPDDTFEALAITERALDGDVEPARIHHGSLDTVANQICGLLMGFGEISARGAYEIVTRAYPFRDLDEAAFKQVVRELSDNRVVWLDEEADRLEKSRGTWQYFYANLSMIPDEANYTVEDVASGRTVGTLAERFVVNFAGQGEVFIQGGEMWRITEVDEDEEAVKVTPVEDPGGEVPSWVGQEIPVPYEVAQHVARLREAAARRFERGDDRDAVAAWLADAYPTDEHTAHSALEQVADHVEADAPVPGPSRVVVEFKGREIVLHTAFGHRTNETLGRVLSALLGQQSGSSVAMEVDPYRVELEVPGGIRASDAVEKLETTDPDHLRPLVELSLKNADSLKFKLAQVAAKFGALKRYRGAGAANFGRDRLLAALQDSPVYDEAVRETLHEDLAVGRAADVLRRVQAESESADVPDAAASDGTHGDGPIDVEVHGQRTPIGLGGRSSGRELLAPENADASVIATVKERLQNDRVILLCCHCHEWDRRQQVKRVPEQPECPNCGSTRVAALNPWADEVVQAVRASEKDEEQERMTERAYRAASLVQSHGKQAVIALAARGVGPHNAAQVINKLREDEDDFYRDILTKERQYARTKSFWD
ncbi:MAG: DEAD/DEAH box helicase [Haloglomus sp.]